MIEVLGAIDSLSLKVNKKNFLKRLQMRVAYGVSDKLIDLCEIPNIGRVRAERLYAAGIKNAKDLVVNADRARQVLNMPMDKYDESLMAAKVLSH